MKPARKTTPLSDEEKYILRVLLYFDIFNHPLLPDEIRRFSAGTVSGLANLNQQLVQLRRRGLLHHIHPFYTLQNNPDLVRKRLEGHARARRHMRIAIWVAKLVSAFPFVRAVMISGSLSKGVAGPSSDIDFFLITHPGRLWIVRGMLAMFKRIFMFNSHRFFCANYYIDTRHLEIEEKNIFTAIETATLIPVYGYEWYQKFITANSWVSNWLPNAFISYPVAKKSHGNGSLVKRATEWILNQRLSDQLDRLIMHFAIYRFRRLYGSRFNPHTYELAFRSRPGISKNHPSNYQEKVLRTLEERLRRFEQEFEISLAS